MPKPNFLPIFRSSTNTVAILEPVPGSAVSKISEFLKLGSADPRKSIVLFSEKEIFSTSKSHFNKVRCVYSNVLAFNLLSSVTKACTCSLIRIP